MSVRVGWRWIALPLLGLLAGGLIGYLIVRLIPPTYEATVTLVVQPGTPAGVQDVPVAQLLAQSYAEALHTRRVLGDAAQQVGLGGLAERDLESRVTARQVAGTQLLRVSVDDTVPSRAADFANAVAQVFIKTNADVQANGYAGGLDNLSRVVKQLQTDLDSRVAAVNAISAEDQSFERDARLAQAQSELTQLRTQYGTTVSGVEELRISEARGTNTVAVFDAAEAPIDPIRPNRTITTLLAAVAGLLAGCGLTMLLVRLDDRLSDRERIATALGLPTIGVLPRGDAKAIKHVHPGQSWVGSYHVLRSRLTHAMRDNAAHTLMVASATQGEGRSTVAANLAIALGEAGQKVILVDADLRRQAQPRLFGLSSSAGLSSALLDDAHSAAAWLMPTSFGNVQVLSAGPAPAEPSALFASQRLRAVIDELAGLCDVLVIDTPPVLAQPDGVLLGPCVDAVLLIVDAGRTHARDAVRALETLQGSGAVVIGVVVNRASKDAVAYAESDGSRHQDVAPVRATSTGEARSQKDRAEAGAGQGWLAS